MAMNGEKAIADLHEFFPVRARLLATHLKEANANGKKRLKEWRERQIVNFIEMLTLNALDLERAYVEERISTLAYTARNLLELSIWVEYCNLSDSNANQFWEDMARDVCGFGKAIQLIAVDETGSEEPGIKKSQDQLAKVADAKFGIKNLDDDYKRVVKAAEELGRGKSFVALNKLFSKFAHPTAWALSSVLSLDTKKGMCKMFLCDGVHLAMKAVIDTREFILTLFPAAPNTPIT